MSVERWIERSDDHPVGRLRGLAFALVGFGMLAIFSVGAPFLLTGVLMLALWRHRSRGDVLAPVLLWPWVFVVTYFLVGPLGCTTTASPATADASGTSFTECSNVIGIDYSGTGSYAPPLLPALLAAAAVATVVSGVLRVSMVRGSLSASE